MKGIDGGLQCVRACVRCSPHTYNAGSGVAPSGRSLFCAMNPKTKSWLASSMATVAFVYSELIRFPLELISASSNIPACGLAAIACFNPSTMPGPGKECAFTCNALYSHAVARGQGNMHRWQMLVAKVGTTPANGKPKNTRDSDLAPMNDHLRHVEGIQQQQQQQQQHL